MFQTFKNAWKVPELRKKILFTLMIILLYRIGATLTVPFVDTAIVDTEQAAILQGGLFQFMGMISGSAFTQATFFALSVSPYITASIVMQLLTIAIPPLERLSKDEEGKKKISAATRWVTVGLALITAYGYVNMLKISGMLNFGGVNEVFGWIVMIACFCAGASLIMWLAEKINDHGIGNGISMILFANILSGGAAAVQSLINMVPFTGIGEWKLDNEVLGYILGALEVLISLAVALAAVILVVWFTNSERRIKVIYAKKVVGRKMYGGQKTNLPLKMNMAGVMPVIFASSIVSIPATIAAFIPNSGFAKFVTDWLSQVSPIYIVIFIVLVVAFSYFYIAISFNPVEVANNIRSNGGAIIGIRPQEMAPFIKKILNRVTLMGAVFLVIIAAVPMIVGAIVTAVGGNFTSLAFAGTSLLIVVGVALETVRDLEAQLSMRNYKGFLD